MRIALHSTTKIVQLNGVPARIWEGTNEAGVKVHAYITRLACDAAADQSEFQKQLQEHSPPSPEIEAIPLRLII